MMAWLHYLAGVSVSLIGIVSVFVLVCRLNPMHARTHRESVLTMNQALGVACIMAAADAVQGRVTMGGAAVVVGTAAWLWVSYATWYAGPPDWTLRPTESPTWASRWARAAWRQLSARRSGQ